MYTKQWKLTSEVLQHPNNRLGELEFWEDLLDFPVYGEHYLKKHVPKDYLFQIQSFLPPLEILKVSDALNIAKTWIFWRVPH